MSDSSWPHGLQPTRCLSPWDSPGKNTGVGCYFLLQGIFSTQGSNLCLLCPLHWQAGSLPPAPPGEPRERVTKVNIPKSVFMKLQTCANYYGNMDWGLMLILALPSLCKIGELVEKRWHRNWDFHRPWNLIPWTVSVWLFLGRVHMQYLIQPGSNKLPEPERTN